MTWDMIREKIEDEFSFAEDNNMELPTLRLDFISGETVDIWYDDSNDTSGFLYSHSDGSIYKDLDSLCEDLYKSVDGFGEATEIEVL